MNCDAATENAGVENAIRAELQGHYATEDARRRRRRRWSARVGPSLITAPSHSEHC